MIVRLDRVVAVARVIAWNSVFAVERLTVACVLQLMSKTNPLHVTIMPHTLRRYSMFYRQSVSK